MTEKRPLVSIGLAVYNGQPFLERAIESLLAQDYQYFELIISDNASTDQTSDICRAYQAKDARIRYHRADSNGGMMWNFRRVLFLAQGEYFMWAANDDIWESTFISKLAAELDHHPEAGVAMSAIQIVGENLQLIKVASLCEGDKTPNNIGYLGMLLRLTTLFVRSSKGHHHYVYGLYRRDLLVQMMEHYENVFFGDRMFITLMALATHFRYVDEPLFLKTRHSASLFERYPHENYRQTASSFFRLFRNVFLVAKGIWNCKLIPVSRKLYIPLAMLGTAKYTTLWFIRNLSRRKA